MSDRPLTVAGLQAKRKELLKLRDDLAAEIRAVVCDIDHLDACIRMFDPDQAPRARPRFETKHRATRGETQRFVLSCLREATEPLTARQMAEAWAKAKGITADAGTLTVFRKRIGVCLIALRADGYAEDVGRVGDLKCWRLKALG